jgi:hypothetical protein
MGDRGRRDKSKKEKRKAPALSAKDKRKAKLASKNAVDSPGTLGLKK